MVSRKNSALLVGNPAQQNRQRKKMQYRCLPKIEGLPDIQKKESAAAVLKISKLKTKKPKSIRSKKSEEHAELKSTVERKNREKVRRPSIRIILALRD